MSVIINLKNALKRQEIMFDLYKLAFKYEDDEELFQLAAQKKEQHDRDLHKCYGHLIGKRAVKKRSFLNPVEESGTIKELVSFLENPENGCVVKFEYDSGGVSQVWLSQLTMS